MQTLATQFWAYAEQGVSFGAAAPYAAAMILMSAVPTLLRMIAGFDRPDAGTITIDGQLVDSTDCFVPPERRRIGYGSCPPA